MTNNQSQKLANQIWAIANSLRGNMDASKFKDYILGVIFYRYLSTRTESYMKDLLKNNRITYREALANPELAPIVRDWAIERLGYIIEPDDLFDSMVKNIEEGKFSIEQFEKAISKLTASTIGQDSENAFANLFDAMDLKDADLGREVSARTKLIATVIQKINATSFAKNSEAGDILGTAYMILIGLFQSGAGKKGGEFFTPTCVSTLLAQLTTLGLDEVRNVCDGCAGSGSLLLEVARCLSTHKVGHFYGQEKTGTTFNLLRMNLIMHDVPYKRFTVHNDDTLRNDNFYYENGEPIQFDIQVENPPYSAPNTASSPEYLEDPRYKSPGVLAPKGKADLAFVESMVYHMAEDGRVAVLLPHGVLFRGGAEQDIRKYLIDRLNVIDAVIGLAPNMFHGTSIPVCILYLKKKRNRNSENILFIEASKYYEKAGKNNILRPSDIKRIVDCVRDRTEVPKVSKKVPLSVIRENDYNMNIPRYVDSSEDTENWDVYSLMFGGVPEAELDALNPCFDAFDGLKKTLFKKAGKSYALNVKDIKKAFYENPAVQKYISDYESAIADMESILQTHLIDGLEQVDVQSEEDILTEDLFARLKNIPLIDRYDAYQLLNQEWAITATDIEIIRADGFKAVNAVDPNMVTKKKSGEEYEVQEGEKGRIFPFSLVQRVKMKNELKDFEKKQAVLSETTSAIEQLVESLSDDDKDYEADGITLFDKDKNAISTKAVTAAMKAFRKEYGKTLDFDEDSIEYKICQLSILIDREKTVKYEVKKATEELDTKAAEIIRSLSKNEAMELLHEKWIVPFISNISGLVYTVLNGYVRSIENLAKKYEVTYEDEATQIRETEESLAEMLTHLKGSDEDNLGIAEWLNYLGGNL